LSDGPGDFRLVFFLNLYDYHKKEKVQNFQFKRHTKRWEKKKGKLKLD